jgi:hypothetical protein
MSTIKLGDCRGIVEAVNEACACGGYEPAEPEGATVAAPETQATCPKPKVFGSGKETVVIIPSRCRVP